MRRLVLACWLLTLTSPAWANDYLQEWVQLPARPDDQAITALGPWRAAPFLASRLGAEGTVPLRVMMALRDLEPTTVTAVLTGQGLAHEEHHVRAMAIETLSHIRAQEAVPAITRLIHDPELTVEMAAYQALARLKASQAVPDLIARGEDLLPVATADTSTSLNALCETLGRIGDARAVSFLRKVLRHPFKDDAARAYPGAAAWALGLLGDHDSAPAIIQADKDGMRALRLLRHPEALQRARHIIRDSLDDPAAEAGWIFEALRVFADMGTAADAPLVKKLRGHLSDKQLIDTLLGGDPPLGEGTFAVETTTWPVFLGWALMGCSDRSGEALIDQALAGDDWLAASEAARVYVRLRRTDKYDEIALAFRRLLSRQDYDTDAPYRGDRGIHARKELFAMLGDEQSPAALQLLVKTLNDANVNGVIVARRAIRRYPAHQSLPLLTKQPADAGEWEKWQIATQMGFSGPDGIPSLQRAAQSAPDALTRAVALRALIQNDAEGWPDLYRRAVAEGGASMKELSDWANHRFENVKPNPLGGGQ